MRSRDRLASQPVASSEIRASACAVDFRASENFRLSLLWLGLSSGRFRVVDHFSSSERHHIVAESSNGLGSSNPHLTEPRVRLLGRALLGVPQKVLALELGVVPSTVSANLRQTVSAMGFVGRASRLPIVLAMAAYAESKEEPVFAARCTALTHGNKCLQVITTDRPERGIERTLSPCEFDVIRLLIEGNSHENIAVLRGTSLRTTANQLATTYRRLGVSGRGELISAILAAANANRLNSGPCTAAGASVVAAAASADPIRVNSAGTQAANAASRRVLGGQAQRDRTAYQEARRMAADVPFESGLN